MACGECSSSDLQRYQELGEHVFDSWEKIYKNIQKIYKAVQKGCSPEKNTGFPMKHLILLSTGTLEVVIQVIISHYQTTIYHLSSEF